MHTFLCSITVDCKVFSCAYYTCSNEETWINADLWLTWLMPHLQFRSSLSFKYPHLWRDTHFSPQSVETFPLCSSVLCSSWKLFTMSFINEAGERLETLSHILTRTLILHEMDIFGRVLTLLKKLSLDTKRLAADTNPCRYLLEEGEVLFGFNLLLTLALSY